MTTSLQILPLITMLTGAASLLISVYALFKIQSLNKLKSTFFSGNNGTSLEGSIIAVADGLKNLDGRQTTTEQNLVELQNQLNSAVQKVGIVRFNPFADGGGNFSFSLALLDSYSSGFVITSMHGREQNRMYTKRIIEGLSESPLTEEEKQAITLANQYNPLHQ